jgi:hypothetical protein
MKMKLAVKTYALVTPSLCEEQGKCYIPRSGVCSCVRNVYKMHSYSPCQAIAQSVTALPFVKKGRQITDVLEAFFA